MRNDRTRSLVTGEGFLRGELAELEKAEVLDHFGGHGLVADVLGVIGDGKEATVYACAAARWPAAPTSPRRSTARRSSARSGGGKAYAGKRTPRTARARRAMRPAATSGRVFAQQEWIELGVGDAVAASIGRRLGPRADRTLARSRS